MARLTRISVLAVLALGMVGLFGSPASAVTEHCPDHEGHPGKVEATNDELNGIVLAEGTEFCVKAGTETTGEESTGTLIANGKSTLCDYLIEAGILDGSGETCKDVSYYVVYEYAPRTDTSALAGGQVPVEFSGGTSPLLIVALITILGIAGARVAFGRIRRS
jgi:hypothetical protein